MKSHHIFLVLFFASLSPLLAENDLIDVYQPTSLFGTEKAGSVIVSRPVMVGGAYPEGPVRAISLPHRIVGAPKGFPKESNLIVLVGADIRVEYIKKEYVIIADFSKAKAFKKREVTIIQVMKMSALCLQKTLSGHQHRPIRIIWLAPKGISIVDANLPLEIKKAENKAQQSDS